MAEFGVRNIIYGWNYSGKTTLSRLFSLLERKQPDPLFPIGVRFSIADSEGQVNENNYQTSSAIVRVFNSDYVQDNLAISWQGKEFNPILLVGKESIDAEQQIEVASAIRDRCKAGVRIKAQEREREEGAVERLKTDAARSFKMLLNYALPFDARHLDKCLGTARLGLTERMSAENYAADLRLAQTSDGDKLHPIDPLTHSLSLDTLRYEADGLRSEIPGVARIIERLRDNPELSNWVFAGLGLHDNKHDCEFCGSGLGEARLTELRDHFSNELRDHQERLNGVLARSDAALVAYRKIRPSDTYGQFHSRLAGIGAALENAVATYNGEVRRIQQVIKAKIRAPFVVPESMWIEPTIEVKVGSLFSELNALISEHNSISENFGAEKVKAIERLKTELALKFEVESDLHERLRRIETASRHIRRYEHIAAIKSQQVGELKAKINLAQKGCEELNGLIGRLLGSEGIKIGLASLNGVDHFQLMRGPPPPRQNSCRLHRTTPGATMKDGIGSIRTSIQRQGGSEVAAAGERRAGSGGAGSWDWRGNAGALARGCAVQARPRAGLDSGRQV
jgi:wobble nucleotide-excising tRNase